MSTDYNATVTGRVEMASGLISLRVKPDVVPYQFEPGQYVVLGLKASAPRVAIADAAEPAAEDDPAHAAEPAAADTDRLIRRAFCVVSDRSASDELEIYMTMVASGELTPRLFGLAVGDRLWIGPRAQGYFTLDKWSRKHVLMIATGTGLAPYMSMLRHELGYGADGQIGLRASFQRSGPRQFVLVHGARHSWDLGYRPELMGMDREIGCFHYLPVISRPAEDKTWGGACGHIQDYVASGVVAKSTGLKITPEEFEVFLAGNPAAVDKLIDWAEARGFKRPSGEERGTLHVEKYWTSGER